MASVRAPSRSPDDHGGDAFWRARGGRLNVAWVLRVLPGLGWGISGLSPSVLKGERRECPPHLSR